MSMYARIIFILLLGGLQVYSVHPIFKDNTYGFLRSNIMVNSNNTITNMYKDDGIEVYEHDDNYLPRYPTYTNSKITEPIIQYSNKANFVNDKQVVTYFDRNHLIDMFRI